MSRGYVYVLTNPSMPGLVKIGRTERSVEDRIAELFQTGVPTPFEEAGSVYTPDCHQLERLMHQAFDDVRVDNCREFFRAESERVIVHLEALHSQVCEEWIERFLPGYVIAWPDTKPDEGHILDLACQLGARCWEVSQAFGELTAAEFAPVLHRWRERTRSKAEVYD